MSSSLESNQSRPWAARVWRPFRTNGYGCSGYYLEIAEPFGHPCVLPALSCRFLTNRVLKKSNHWSSSVSKRLFSHRLTKRNSGRAGKSLHPAKERGFIQCCLFTGIQFPLCLVTAHASSIFSPFFIISPFHARITLTICYNLSVGVHSLYFWVACAFTSAAIIILVMMELRRCGLIY